MKTRSRKLDTTTFEIELTVREQNILLWALGVAEDRAWEQNGDVPSASATFIRELMDLLDQPFAVE